MPDRESRIVSNTHYVVRHRPGPRWQTGIDFREQIGVRAHVDQYTVLLAEGMLELKKLKSRLEVTSVLSTAGGILNGALLREGLVDEINIEFLPAVIGGMQTPSLFTSPDLESGEWPVQLELISAHVQAGGQVWLRYKVEHRKA